MTHLYQTIVSGVTDKLDLYSMIGFDARQLKADQRDPSPRSISPLRDDIAQPFSVDVMVWKSIYDLGTELTRPVWVGPIQNQWENLLLLMKHLEDRWTWTSGPFTVIASALLRTDASSLVESLWQGALGTASPASPVPSWSFLGFDVADRFLQSGLANSVPSSRLGFNDLRRDFGHLLNRYHLFSDAGHGAACCEVINRLAPEHAPFFVFGIWSVASWEPTESSCKCRLL